MDPELLKAIISTGGTGGLLLVGVWAILSKAFSTFTKAVEEVNSLHKERADKMEIKLESCEKKHHEVIQQIGQLREDNGILKGKVETLERFSAPQKARQSN